MTDRAAAAYALIGFALVAISGVLLRPLLPIDETRYLTVAWEMWLSGDWLVPTKNFAIYTHKPPLLFWAINLVWAMTGVSDSAARMVGPGFAVLTIMLAGQLARRLWRHDAGAGPRAVLALSGMLIFGFYGGLTMFDAALAAATVGAMLALVDALDTGHRRYWCLLGLAIAVGVLAKGPVILIHVLPAMLSVKIWASGKMALLGRRLLGGVGLALAVALGLVALWLLPAILAGGPEYRDAILWTQSAGRMSNSFAHAKPWWFYVALLPALLFPWVFVPGVVRASFRGGIWREPGLRLALIWIGSALLVFSLISGKQAHYLVPELVAGALVVARLTRDRRGSMVIATLPVILLAIASLLVAADLLPLGKAGDLLRPRSIPLAWALLVLAVCWIAIRLGGLRGGVVLSLGFLLAFNLAVGLSDTRDIYDTGPLASLVAPGEREGIAFYGQIYHAEFNFAGRLMQPVANPLTESALAAWQAAHPKGLVIARPDRTRPAWSPRRTVRFRNSPYAIWNVQDASTPEINS